MKSFFKKITCQAALVALLLFVWAPDLQAQQNTQLKPRILVLLDGSSSMVENWNSTHKRYEEASRFIVSFMDSMRRANPDVEFALRVFGHQYGVPENNCYDTKMEVNFGKANLPQIGLRLKDIKPYGVSPIAYALQEAAQYDLGSLDKYYYSLVLITDGGESCGGDICDVVEKLISKKIFFKPYIVSLIDYSPFSAQYACLGNMLNAADEKGFNQSLKTLVDAHKKIIEDVKINPQIAQPTIKTIETTPSPAGSTTMATMAGRYVNLRLPTSIPEYRVAKQKKVEGRFPLVRVADFPADIVLRVTAPAIAKLNRFNKVQLPYTSAKAQKLTPKNYQVNFPLVRSTDFPVEVIPRATTPVIVSLIAHRKIKLIPTIYGTANPKLKSYKVDFPLVKPQPAVPEKPAVVQTLFLPNPPSPDTKPATPKPRPKPAPVRNVEKIKDAEFVKETEESLIEELFVYFSDGKGKYYKTEPQISITTAETNQPVKTFYRTVNRRTGEPDGQKLDAGIYNLLVVGRSNTYVRRLVIEKGKKTKLNIIVTNGSLKFEFLNNPKRPISEYSAIVNRRFTADPDVRQNASELRPYEPGTYYAEVNTFPPYKAAFEIGFDEQVTIQIPEPGEVQFLNENPTGKVGLFLPLGDKYAQFGQVIIDGHPEEQILNIQPGIYQARYKKNPRLPMEEDTIITFKVESNRRTEVILPQ